MVPFGAIPVIAVGVCCILALVQINNLRRLIKWMRSADENFRECRPAIGDLPSDLAEFEKACRAAERGYFVKKRVKKKLRKTIPDYHLFSKDVGMEKGSRYYKSTHRILCDHRLPVGTDWYTMEDYIRMRIAKADVENETGLPV